MKYILVILWGVTLLSELHAQENNFNLLFNGSNQKVTAATLSPHIGNGDFTIECYVKFNSFANYGGLATTFNSGTGGWALHQQLDGSISFLIGINSSGGNFDQVSSAPLSLNIWYHVAAIKRGSNIELYINGEFINSTTSNRTVTYNNFHIGARYTNFSFWYHNGEIDEVRVWDQALSQNNIRNWMCKKVTATHPAYDELLAYYNFDEGSGSTLTDFSTNSNTGTLINSPTWQNSSVPIGDESIYIQNVSDATSVQLTHPGGDALNIDVTAGTADALFVYRIDNKPNISTAPSGLENLSALYYWGVQSFGSSGLIYEVAYDYSGHTGISDENNLRLCSRPDNTASEWTLESALLNTTDNTLTLGGQTGTEFIIGSTGDNPLPVSLRNFSIRKNKLQLVEINWETLSETNNAYFTLLRSNDAKNWQELIRKKGHTNSKELKLYTFTDRNPKSGTNYYQLKQTDTDGKTTYFNVKSIHIHFEKFSMYPNPAKEYLTVKANSYSFDNLEVYNILGKNITNQLNITYSNSIARIDVSSLKYGSYLVKVDDFVERLFIE